MVQKVKKVRKAKWLAKYGETEEYIRKGGGGFTRFRKKAQRYKTRKEALAATCYENCAACVGFIKAVRVYY